MWSRPLSPPARTVRAFCLYNSFGSAGWLDESEPFQAALDRRAGRAGAGRHPRRRAGRLARVAGVDARPAPGRADRDPLLLRGAAVVRRDQRHRHAQRAGGRAPPRRAAHGAHLDLGGLRHAGHRADHRDACPARPIPLQRNEDRRGQAVRVVRPVVRDAGRDAAPVQHVRPTPVGAGRHPDRARPAALRRHRAALGLGRRRNATSPIVTDTCAGFLRAAMADLEPGETVQLGTGTDYSIGEVVAAVPEDHRIARRGRHRRAARPTGRLRGPGAAVRPGEGRPRCSAGHPPSRSRTACDARPSGWRPAARRHARPRRYHR